MQIIRFNDIMDDRYKDRILKIRELPNHIAIIMDGNRRWSKLNKKDEETHGHFSGYCSFQNLFTIICGINKFRYITIYALSKDNSNKRDFSEINIIMSLFIKGLVENLKTFVSNDIKVKIIGDRIGLSDKVKNAVDEVETNTAQNKGTLLTIAFNYSGYWDIQEAFCNAKKHNFENSKYELPVFYSFLPTSYLPPVDLLIRTGGEFRLSNFLPCQLTYAELYFINVFWPDFTIEHFIDALKFFESKNRRFGGN